MILKNDVKKELCYYQKNKNKTPNKANKKGGEKKKWNKIKNTKPDNVC